MDSDNSLKLPKSFQRAQDSLNVYHAQAMLELSEPNTYWLENSFKCDPFSTLLRCDIEESKIAVEISVGRVINSAALEEQFETFPFPLNYSYKLEPNPTFTVKNSRSFSEHTEPEALYDLISATVALALMSLQMLIHNDNLFWPDASTLDRYELNVDQKYWGNTLVHSDLFTPVI